MEPWHYAELLLGSLIAALMGLLTWNAQRVLRQIELVVIRADAMEGEVQKMALRIEQIRGDIMLHVGQTQTSAQVLQLKVDADHARLGTLEDVALRTSILVDELMKQRG